MSFDKIKYIYISVVAVVAAATLYVTFSLIKDGTPTVKSQNEYLVEANRLHADSLFEEAVEPYMKACAFNEQQSLANYNAATNSIMKNYDQLSKVFNEEGYQLDGAVDSALVDATKLLDNAGKEQPDTARYSSIYQNIGVTEQMRNNLDAAAEAYKEALRKNPADEDARYNLAVILHQKKNEQQNQQQQQQDKEQQQDQQDKEQQEQQEQQEKQEEEQQNKEQQEQEQQNQQQQEKEENQAQQQQGEQQEEKEKIEQMLKALMQDEKEIREKMEEAEKVNVKAGGIEKNW